MYAIRYYGMYVRNDGLMTSAVRAAKLFDTAQAAEDYLNSFWFANSGVSLPPGREAVEVIEVVTKVVMHKFVKVVKSL